jgi:hypothetical protein
MKNRILRGDVVPIDGRNWKVLDLHVDTIRLTSTSSSPRVDWITARTTVEEALV